MGTSTVAPVIPLYPEETVQRIEKARLLALSATRKRVWQTGVAEEGGHRVIYYRVNSFTKGGEAYRIKVSQTGGLGGYCYSRGLAPVVWSECSCEASEIYRKPCKHGALVQLHLEREKIEEQQATERGNRLLRLFDSNGA